MDENIPANSLTILDDPDSTQSFLMIDVTSNKGYLLDYNKLAETIIGKLYSETQTDDSAKIYFVG